MADVGISASVVNAGALAAALDCVFTPTFLLHSDGRIAHVNIAGNELLRNGLALRKNNFRLVARRSSEAKLLAVAVLRVADSQQPELFRLLSRDGSLRLLMTITPVPGDTLVAACVADLQADASRTSRWIQEAFHLSRENAELAEGLISGLSLAEFSVEKEVTLGAVRTRLKKLFAQTGKRSQATLVAALLRASMIAPRRLK
ncbi:helix-turn-helix transcriptional regulator [Rhodopila sp.]|uniref:helix-turn-helix transcriptional regulator n=1 Tax=Rhodopila sp. TaxID=2480087 RepID=UPI003D0E83C9